VKHDEIVSLANHVHDEYKAMKLKLTLRQLFYQFVRRGWTPNNDKVYKKIGNALTKARYEGAYPLDGLMDRGRTVHHGDFTINWDNVDDALDVAGDELKNFPEYFMKRARWYGQECHVSVWVEKEALAGVFEDVCQDLGVAFFACKGYPSVSALWSWLEQAYKLGGEEGYMGARTILYFGDHDPDGWEIPRSAERNLYKMMRANGLRFPIDVERVALNMDQIEELNPPPFEAKKTSSRYKKYFKEHNTDDAWELDALDPDALQRLIRENVEEYFDEDAHAKNEDLIFDRRQEMLERMRADGWAQGALA
jgi:hypothetical protein